MHLCISKPDELIGKFADEIKVRAAVEHSGEIQMQQSHHITNTVHFMICHSYPAIGPAPQAVTKNSEMEQNTTTYA